MSKSNTMFTRLEEIYFTLWTRGLDCGQWHEISYILYSTYEWLSDSGTERIDVNTIWYLAVRNPYQKDNGLNSSKSIVELMRLVLYQIIPPES